MLKLAGPVNCKVFACSPHGDATLVDKQKHLPTFVRIPITLCESECDRASWSVCLTHDAPGLVSGVLAVESEWGGVLDEALGLSVPQFPLLYDQDSSACLWELMRSKCVLPCNVLRAGPGVTSLGAEGWQEGVIDTL